MAFMSVEEWRKKKEAGNTQGTSKSSAPDKSSSSSSSKESSGGSSGYMTLEEWRAKREKDSAQRWAEAASSLMNDTQKYYSNWRKKDDPQYSSYQNRISDLLSQADGWRKQYAGDKEAISSIDSVVAALSDAKQYAFKNQEYYSQWDTEDDYKSYLASQKDYEEKSRFDITAGEKEIAHLENVLEKYKSLTRFMTDEKGAALAESIRKQYGDEAGIKDLISQKKQYLNQARHIQEGMALAGVADRGSENYDSGFNTYSQYKTTIKENPAWWEDGVGDKQYEWINNKNGFRDEYEASMRDLNTKNGASSQSGFYVGTPESSFYEKGYDKMNSSEIAIYNYYYAKEGKEKAQEYLDSIQESLNHRKATAMFEGMEDRTFQELIFGVEAGLDQFTSGMANLFNKDDYIPQSAVQMASAMVRGDLEDDGAKLPDWLGGASLGQVGYDAITTTANMAPSILTSMGMNMLLPGSGAVVGTTLMGASAAGGAYQEALNNGFDKDQARGYAALVGISEAILGYALSGISAVGGKLSNKAIEGFLNKVDNALLRTAGKIGGSMLSEFSEEYLQEVLTPVFSNLALGTDEEINLISSEALYSGLLGALTAGIMEGPSTIAGEVSTYKTGKQLQKADISAQRIADLGKTFSADTVAYQLAGRVNENTGAYTMGRLFNEIGATMTEQNVSDLTEALAKTMPRDMARTNAEIMAKVVEGATLPDKFVDAMNEDEVLAEAMRTTLIDSNATWWQRSKGYNDALMALAQERTAPGQEKASAPDAMDTENIDGSEAVSEADIVPTKAKSISAIKDGQVTLKMEDGSEVNLQEAGIDPDDAVRIDTIASIEGISSADANFVLNTLRESTNTTAQYDAQGAKEAYKYGYYGFSDAHLTKHGVFAGSLSDVQRKAIYDVGRKARAQKVAQATPVKTAVKTATTGKVHFEGDRSTLTERQSASLTAMEKVADALGVQIHVFESKVGANGKRIGANGWYDPKDSSIHIDLHAGANGEGTMLFTAAHELTHHIRKWSPEKFKTLSDFLMQEYGKKGVNVDGLVREQMEKAKRNGRTISYDTAFEEVVADSMETMLADGNVMEKLAKLKQQDKTLWQKLKDFISELAAKIRSVYEGLAPDSVEGRYVAEMKDSIEKLQELFTEGLVEASENYQASLTPGEEGVVANQNGDPVAYATSDGSVLLSMRTYEEDGREAFRKYLQKCVSSKKLTKAEMQEMLNGIEEIYQTCKEFKDKYAPFSAWSDAAVVRDTRGKPVFSVVTPNGDYKMNLDFSLVCKKRRTLDAVFNEMSRRGIIDDFELGQKSVVKINEIIRKHGLETACALCFVDAKRFRQASMADQFTSLYNELVESLVPEDQKGSIDHFNFAGYATIKKVDGGIDTWANSKLDFSHINHVLKTYGDGTVEYKAAKYIKNNPQGRKLLLRGDFMSSQGFDAVKSQNQDILKLYNSKKGTGGPKAAFGDVQYMNEIIQKARWWTPKKAYAVGGVRIQSFSDYVPRMVFDYTQMIYDLAATKLPAHACTKEALFVKQFGLTGVKINMSLIPAIAEGGIAPGLDANGNYVWAGESFDFETAKEIQNAEGYTENCGTICVGVSDRHIRKLLSDPDIRMVIPYHKSGLNPIVAHMNKIAEFADYTLKQNTTVKGTTTKAEKHFDFNEALHKMGENADPRAVIQQYFDWCDENGYDPKFADFRDHPNYYKLIEDFTLYDKDGKYVPQREVRAVFPTKDSAFGSMKDLIQEGLQEDAIVEGKRDKNLSAIVDEIQRTIPKTEAEISEEQVSQADRDLEAVELSDTDIKYSIREEAPPKKVGVAYKVFLAKDGELYPPMVANPNGEGTPVGVWLNADIGKAAPPSKTGRPQVQGGGKGTNSGKISLAFRPGWHLGDIPLAKQFAKVNPETGVKELFPANFVWAECEYAMDVDYQEEAMSYGYTENGKFRHSYAGLPKLPADGYYRYRTNPNPDTVPWVITGAMRVKRILTDAETDAICRKNGVEPMARQGGPINLSDFGLTAGDTTDIKYSDRDTESVSNRSLLANAFEGVAQNDIERNKIQEYKGKIDLINSEEQKLRELTEQIKDLSFAKGPKDTKAIRDLQFEARQTANRISTYDKQLLRLEASKPLQNVLDREKKMAYQRAEKKGKEALAAYREKATKTQRELMDKYQEARKRSTENREKTAMRHQIQNVVNELNQYLLSGNKDKRVMMPLKKAVAEALDAVNMDTVGAEERIAKLQAEMMKAKTPEEIQRIAKKIERVQQMGDKMSSRLKALKEAYREIAESDDPLIANAHDDVIEAKLESVIEKVGDTPLRDMNLEQLSEVYDMYRMVLTTIRNSNKAFKAAKTETIASLGNQVMQEVEKVGGKRKYNLAAVEAIKKFGWNNLKPVYAFEHIGSNTFTRIFNNVRAGEDVWAKDVTEARSFYLEKAKKYGFDSWKMDKWHRFTSASGMDFNLNLEQIMSLYAYSKRDQAADHLRRGGIVIDESTEITMKTKLGFKAKFNPTEATAYNISDETLDDIVSKLTPQQKQFVDEMQEYLSTTMGNKGNEVSLELYGIKLFKEKFYFPLKSASQFMAKAKEQQQGEVKIKNSGFSKETVKKANNPIVLTPFMNVWANHVNEMSMYHAFVLPMEDFYRVYNYRTPTHDSMATESVEMFIQNAYGKGATRYIDQLLKDLNGGARTDSTTGPINKMMGMFKKGAVFASASVVIQQPSAIARATALVDLKYFIGPKVDHKRHAALWDEVKQYAPVAIIKEMGYFDTNMGKSTQDFILGKEYSSIKEKAAAFVKDSGYRDEILSKAPALADEIAWCSIWEAVKRETKAKNKGIDVKSEAFLKKAGERFTEVITKTQVYDSVLARSANMRSKDTGMKMATAFMAEPTTSINMITEALVKAKRGDKKTCRKAIGSVIAAQILNAFLVSWVYAARDDDEDETFREKYISSFVGAVMDGMNPATYIPFIKDIVSIVQGYDVERSDMAVISDLWNAWQQLKKDDVSVWRKVEGFVGSICQIFGLPVKNIMRDARAAYQAFDTIVNGEKNTVRGTAYAIVEGLTGDKPSNPDQLYNARKSGDKDHAARVEGRYDDEDSANAAVRQAIKDRYMDGELTLAQATMQLTQYAGMEADDAYENVRKWDFKAKYGFAYDDRGDAYKSGKISARDLKNALMDIGGKTADEADEYIAELDFEKDYGFAWSDREDAYKDGNISEHELKSILMDVGGKTEEEADLQIQAYDWEVQGYEGVTSAAVREYNEHCDESDVPKDVYLYIRKFSNNTDNDVDEQTGKTIYYSAMKKIMAEIDAQDELTADQKDAIARSLGWSEKNIQKYKLW